MNIQEDIRIYKERVAGTIREAITTGIQENGKYKVVRFKAGQNTGYNDYVQLQLADERQDLVKLLILHGDWVDEISDDYSTEEFDEIFCKVMEAIPETIKEFKQKVVDELYWECQGEFDNKAELYIAEFVELYER